MFATQRNHFRGANRIHNCPLPSPPPLSLPQPSGPDPDLRRPNQPTGENHTGKSTKGTEEKERGAQQQRRQDWWPIKQKLVRPEWFRRRTIEGGFTLREKTMDGLCIPVYFVLRRSGKFRIRNPPPKTGQVPEPQNVRHT